MTVTPAEQKPDQVTLTIDGFEVTVPKGTLVIRAAEDIGIPIPRFCDHPLLDPLGACRQCLVEVEGQRKPLASCTTTVSDGMVVRTHLTSTVADKAQQGVMELLLINHPLDCPVCDKGGECPLQNQAMSNGRADSRFRDVKRTYPKPLAISSQVLLDRERCILCARCTRFAKEIAGDPFIELYERAALEQVAISTDKPFQSYFSGNVVQICPVGALTGASYRFRARPFDLMSTPSVCEHCASGCAQRTDWRRQQVTRRLAGNDPAVNEEWNCDKGRWAFRYAFLPDRIREPLVRDDEGYLTETSWTEALDGAAAALRDKRVGVLTGGRLTLEDAYAYAKFARTVLGTNDVDFRARPHSAEEADFLAARVAGRPIEVCYDDFDRAPAVLLVGLEPEEESPIVFLRLRKAFRKRGLKVFAVSPYRTAAHEKTGASVISAAPGTEPEILDALAGSDAEVAEAAAALRREGALVLVGERLAGVPGALSAAARLADSTGARLAWIPRRAGDRGAVEAGLLPSLLPGGRPLSAAGQLGWSGVPTAAGRSTAEIIEAAASGELDALVVAGVDPEDLPDPVRALEAFESVGFLLSLELRESEVTARANVVLPIAPAVEKAGTYVDWEGRPRPFDATLRNTGALSDARALHQLAAAMRVDLGLATTEAVRAELARVGVHDGPRPGSPSVAAAEPPAPEPGQAVLATWALALDRGRLQDGEPNLAGTARPAVVRMSATTAREIGAAEGEPVTVASEHGALTLPLVVTDMPDRVVWVPTNSPGSTVRPTLRVGAGAVVRISAANAAGSASVAGGAA
jgi:NADH-quinone oxidoreductase subunit G